MLLSLEDNEPDIKKVKFTPFEDQGTKSNENDFDILNNLKIEMIVELANTTITLREVLALEEGNLIPLEKVAGEPVDIKLNDSVFAKGEVVIINEVFGIRVGTLMDKDNQLGG